MQGGSHTPTYRRFADVVFLLDITGANASFIETLTHSLAWLALPTDWRARVIGFRDAKCDGDSWLVSNPFVSNDLDGLRAQLENIQCLGGGDEPESLLDALDFVCSLPEAESNESTDEQSWRHATDSERIVFVYTDATFHPSTLDGSATVRDIAARIMEKRLRLLMIRPDAPCFDIFDAVPNSMTVVALAAPYSESARELCPHELTKRMSSVWKGTAKHMADPQI